MRALLHTLLTRSHDDGAVLLLFVRCTGVVLALRALELLLFHVSYVERTTILFDYWGFGWLPKPPAEGVYALLLASLIAGVVIARSRVASRLRKALIVSAVCWSYFLLLDKAFFGHVNYAIACLLWALVLVRAWRLGLFPGRALRIDLLAVRLMVALMYFYAGVIKLSPDWLSGDVIARFFEGHPPFLPVLTAHPVLVALSVGGCVFDLVIGPLLLVPRTRHVARRLVLCFHLGNFILLDVPVVAMTMLTFTLAAFAPAPFAKKTLAINATPHRDDAKGELRAPSRARLALLGLFLCAHFILPLRPYVMAGGDHRWTHVAQDFSWWLRSTFMQGAIAFYVKIDGAPEFKVDVGRYVDTQAQSAFALDPFLIAQFVRHLDARLRTEHPTAKQISIRVESTARLNGCATQPFLREGVDLAHEPLRHDMSHLLHPLDHVTCRELGDFSPRPLQGPR